MDVHAHCTAAIVASIPISEAYYFVAGPSHKQTVTTKRTAKTKLCNRLELFNTWWKYWLVLFIPHDTMFIFFFSPFYSSIHLCCMRRACRVIGHGSRISLSFSWTNFFHYRASTMILVWNFHKVIFSYVISIYCTQHFNWWILEKCQSP